MLEPGSLPEHGTGQASWPGHAMFRKTSRALLGGSDHSSSKGDRRSNSDQCTHTRLVVLCLAMLATGALFGALARARLADQRADQSSGGGVLCEGSAAAPSHTPALLADRSA